MEERGVLMPDTNIFLNYPSIEQVDWLKLADAKAAHLVICTTVVGELDNKKDHSLLGDRARRALATILRLAEGLGTVREALTFEIVDAEVRHEDFTEGLSPLSSDDEIIAHLLRYINPDTG